MGCPEWKALWDWFVRYDIRSHKGGYPGDQPMGLCPRSVRKDEEVKTMDYSMSPISKEDREPIMDIFNHYVENTFAAYFETKLPYEAFEMFLQMAQGYPTARVTDKNGRVIGFGLLRSHHPMPTFARTAEITYFIHPDHTGKGIGAKLLSLLEKEGMKKGITNILANISSLNPGSINFHKRNGFVECGRFKRVGMKMGKLFDTVWMQKVL